MFRLKMRPSRGLPAFEVMLIDDSGSVIVVWTGRRAIGGIGLGRRLVVEGVPMEESRGLVFTNPAYELR